ncbi:hypothetical protein [Cellulomonas sp. NS3]|nr:hypothetical protein [Cellulomonas sp. NS3]
MGAWVVGAVALVVLVVAVAVWAVTRLFPSTPAPGHPRAPAQREVRE